MEGLQLFDKFLKSVTEAVIESEELDDFKFRNRTSGVSRTIPIYLKSEGEEFGMSLNIYNCLMAFKKSKPRQFDSMMTSGNSALEGNSSYQSRKVVISVPNRKMTDISHAPLSFMEVYKAPVLDSIIGVKRKPRERGPGKKDFTSFRTPIAASQTLNNKLIDVIDEFFKSNENENNREKILQLALNSVGKKIQITDEKMDSDNDIILSAKQYLEGSSLHGGKFIATQAMIDTILTSLASSKSSNHKLAKALGVVREFCHNACRMDSFNSSHKIQVHNYDGSFEYH